MTIANLKVLTSVWTILNINELFKDLGSYVAKTKVDLARFFGTSNCKQCSSLWLLVLLPVAALAGVLLVISLMMLNLTVAVSTINGLIFYANIVKANEATFILPEAIGSPLSVFIAWLNLDLGTEVCFYDGLGWPGSVKTRFAFHIELGYTIVDLDIRYFAVHWYTVYVCGHRSACAVTELPCAVTDPRVRSPNCSVRSPIRVCGHRTAMCGHRSWTNRWYCSYTC